jgi:catechol 2,3-dioxygenase-like lactoylglutathione lyase family enzyme
MGYHHLALATHDMVAIDKFYTHAMGFELVKMEKAGTPDGGWAKHFFYETGGGEMMAFWELHDESLRQDFPTGLAKAVGLPEWTNHLAFSADDMADLEKKKQRWLETGYHVLEIDHNWCYSIYTNDPDGTMVEFCLTTGEFSDDDKDIARKALTSDELPDSKEPTIQFHKTENKSIHLSA